MGAGASVAEGAEPAPPEPATPAESEVPAAMVTGGAPTTDEGVGLCVRAWRVNAFECGCARAHTRARACVCS